VLRALIAIVAVVVVVAGCGDHARTSGDATMSEFGFVQAAGWQTDSTGLHPSEPQAPAVRASTTTLDDPPGSVPGQTLKRMPADGIVIVVYLYRPYGGGPNGFPPRKLPLQLGDADVSEAWEGQPNPSVPRYQIQSAVNGFWVEADVFFGTQRPDDDLASGAQAELARLRLSAA
jgi:hypothetical protein